MPSIFVFILGCVLAIPALVWATDLKSFSITRFLAFFGPILLGLPWLLTRRRPTWLILMSMIMALPILGLIMPPARFGLSAFNIISLLLLLFYIQAKRDECPQKLFSRDLRHYWLPLLLLLPSVLLGINVQHSAMEWLLLWGYFAVVVVGIGCFNDQRNIDTTHVLLSIALIIIAFSVLIQKLAGFSFSWLYAERSMVAAGGTFVQQGSGVFQDPQKAAQVIAMLAVYLAVIWQRKAIPSGAARLVVLISILFAIPALLMTLSRIAIAAGAFFGLAGILLLGRHAPATRTMVRVLGIGIVAVGLLALGGDGLIGLLPVELQKRFVAVDESAALRLKIWSDSFAIFVAHPLFGIGPGNYREYLAVASGLTANFGSLPSGLVIPDQPESGYLKILYEVGILGTIGMVWFMVGVGARISFNLRSPLPEVRSRAWAASAALGVFLVTFVTLFTTSDARSAFIPALLIGIVQADRARHLRPGMVPNLTYRVPGFGYGSNRARQG